MENKLQKPRIWTNDVRIVMIEKSEFYSNPLIYQFGYYDGYHKGFENSKAHELLEMLKELHSDITKDEFLHDTTIKQWFENRATELESLIKEANTI